MEKRSSDDTSVLHILAGVDNHRIIVNVCDILCLGGDEDVTCLYVDSDTLLAVAGNVDEIELRIRNLVPDLGLRQLLTRIVRTGC
jgi:hypothetical protein